MAQKNWVIEMQDELDKMSDTSSEQKEQRGRRSIYQLHPCITSLNKEAFKPKLVSFGPYHHDEEHLKQMEEHKKRALKHFLRKSAKPCETFVNALSRVVGELKDSYDPLAPEWRENTDRFLKMMLLDGCFMLEILRVAAGTCSDYAYNDPIFSEHGKLYVLPLFRRDMLMMENQLPILVLDRLLTNGGKVKEDESAEKLIVKFLRGKDTELPNLQGKCLHALDVCWNSFLSEKPPEQPPPGENANKTSNNTLAEAGKCLHVLDVCRNSFLSEKPLKKPPPVENANSNNIIHSATTLAEAGIVLKTSNTRSLRDVTFSGGVLRLPRIMVDDTTESTFLNLMAFERYHVGAGNEVTSYIFFMDSIIDTEHDVALLISKGIILNAFGSNKAVADLFNSLSKDTTADHEGQLAQVHGKVNAYCEKPWNAWRANLFHTYFHNPWAMLSLIAAIFLFALTIVQTIYTVYPYYSPRGNFNHSDPLLFFLKVCC